LTIRTAAGLKSSRDVRFLAFFFATRLLMHAPLAMQSAPLILQNAVVLWSTIGPSCANSLKTQSPFWEAI